MLQLTESLLALQDRDQKIKMFRTELASIPVERAARERQLADAQARLESAKTRAKGIEVEKKGLEVEAQSKRDTIAKYKNQQLQTRKNEEYTALSHEIQGAEKVISSIEDHEIELMEEAESLRPKITEAERAYAEDKAKFDTQIAGLEEKRKNLEARVAELESDRTAMAAGIDEDLLYRYDRLFKTKNGTVVVPLENEICMGCHMKVTVQTVFQVKAQNDIVHCPQCGRILYLEP